jgi:NADP-dependent 3-hydroxy acid dehydrogenase YdfG
MTTKTAFITGASSGIGKACAQAFAAQGYNLILCSRSIDKLEQTATHILKEYAVQILTTELDVRNKAAVADVVNNLPSEWQAIDVLLNNAGLARGFATVQDGQLSDWDEMIDTNVKGLMYVTRAVLPFMAKRKSGHILTIGSLAGRAAYPNGAVYCASKAAVKIFCDGLRMDTVNLGIKVTDIQPGLVETNFSNVRFHGDNTKADNVYKGFTPLSAEDVADAVLFAATRPAHVQINEILLTPTAQASSTVVNREA